MSSDQEDLSHTIVGQGIHRVEESPFLEVEKPTMGSLQLMRRRSTLQTKQLCQLWRLDQGPPPRVPVISIQKLKAESHI